MWIIGKRYDIAFIFGGATASLAVPFIVMWNPSLLPVLFWAWLLIFDGTHLWAAYSRTYVDRQFWKTDRNLLLWSPIFVLLPLLAVTLQSASGSMKPVHLFLLFAQGWAYYHVVRQHYGFVSLYDRKAGTDSSTHLVNKWTLYAGLWTPYLFFLATHPVNRQAANLPSLAAGSAEANWIPGIATAFSAAVLLRFALYHFRRRRQPGSGSIASQLFVFSCLLVYSLIFYWIAPMEPFLPGARNVVQSFMLVGIMMTLFHNIQYHAIVWHYNRRKYNAAGKEHGWAHPLNRNFAVYAVAGLVFSAGYVATAWFSTEYPSLSGRILEPVFVPAAFCIWWGLLFHHYYLDQKIWRVGKTKDLQEQLGLVSA